VFDQKEGFGIYGVTVAGARPATSCVNAHDAARQQVRKGKGILPSDFAVRNGDGFPGRSEFK